MSWVYWILGSFFYFYQFIFRTIFATLGDEVTAGFHISVAELSSFFAASTFTYALMQIPGGVLMDALGPRRVMSAAMAILATGVMLVGFTDSYSMAIFGRVLMGLGSAFAFLGTNKLVLAWFPFHMLSFLTGCTVLLGTVGGGMSQRFFEMMSQDWDWRSTLLGMGASGLVFAGLMALILRDRTDPQETVMSSEEFLKALKSVFVNPYVILAGLFMFCAYLPISVIGDSWGPIAFEKIFDAPKEVANQAVSYFYVAMACGAFFFSAVGSYTRRYKAVLLVECLMMLASLSLLFITPEFAKNVYMGIPMFLLLASFTGFSIGGIALVFPIGCSHVPKAIAGTAVGVINMLCMMSGSLFSGVFKFVLENSWDGAVSATGVPIYASHAYLSAMRLLIYGTVVSILLLLSLKEKKMT